MKIAGFWRVQIQAYIYNNHTLNNGGKRIAHKVRRYITSKRIEIENPGWSGFKAFLICNKTLTTRIYSLIRLNYKFKRIMFICTQHLIKLS